MTVFINPFTDTGFKIIFGTEHVSEELLVSFLNGLFADDPVLSKIKTVKYLPSERVREWDEGKSIVYDIHCQTSTGHKFILEMQLNEQEYFLKRAFYYFCRGIAEQGYKGQKSLKERREDGVTKQADLLSDDSGSEISDMEYAGSKTSDIEYAGSEKFEMEEREYWDYDFIPVVGVIFSNFFIKGLDRKLVTFMKMTDSETHKPIGDFMHAAFIQLPAFDKRKEDCKTLFDEWMYNLTHMASMETMAFTSHQDIFNRLAKVANLATLSPAQRRQYDYDLKKARDYHNEMK
ncbi:MAG: Rpn family recombination-promoting nuclease/putative transposase, partial [Muribaculaceae bacterium]|nr:Rpn family recombination-promoting nuclease/putative transposase [Muribaculaceae bacterium]